MTGRARKGLGTCQEQEERARGKEKRPGRAKKGGEIPGRAKKGGARGASRARKVRGRCEEGAGTGHKGASWMRSWVRR